jgi:acetyl esterase/lipase
MRCFIANNHSGGGLPELQAAFCNRVCEETGAVAISISYRYAPVHPFPAAIDDVDAIIRYIRDNAIYKYGADPNLLTVSGASAGGNLALAATQQPDCHAPSPVAIKAMVVYYPVVCL